MRWIPKACEDLHTCLEVVDRLLPPGLRGKIQFLPPEEGDSWTVKHFLPEVEEPDNYPIYSLDITLPTKKEHFVLIPHPKVVETAPPWDPKSQGFAAISVERVDGETWVDPEPWAREDSKGIAIWAMETVSGETMGPEFRAAIRLQMNRVISARFETPLQMAPATPLIPLVTNAYTIKKAKKETGVLLSLPPDPQMSDWGTGVPKVETIEM